MVQLCWSCKNTNRFNCSWFDINPKLPDNVELKNGYITQCKGYKPMKEKLKNLSNKQIAKLLGVNLRTFYRHKEEYLEAYFNQYYPTFKK